MNKTKKSILLIGNGHMGKAILQELSQHEELTIAAVCSKGSLPAFPSSVSFDAVIDFSHPDALTWLLPFLQTHPIPYICGTTGCSAAQQAALHALSKTMPVFYDTCFSVGLTILKELLPQISFLSSFFDTEIIELHHRSKKDMPSGTARMLAKQLCSRQEDGIPIHSLRGGTIAGEHQIHLLGQEEELTFIHTVHSRSLYAKTALLCTCFLLKQKAGWYDMRDFLHDQETLAKAASSSYL